MTNLFACSCSLLLIGCALSDDDDPDCTGGRCDVPDQTCDDPRYGDGTCNPELACAVPDLDCFRTFEDDQAAAAWFSEIERSNAQQQGRPARGLLPVTDPRHAEVRAMLDRGWSAFSEQRPVGRLAELRPALVMVDDPTVNAFVFGDAPSGTAGFAVMVQTGALAARSSDDAMLGLMMHELQHAVGLHVVPGVQDRMRRFYIAYDGEPIGNAQVDDPRARAAGEAWLDAAGDAGSYPNAELGGMFFGGDFQDLVKVVVDLGKQQNPAGCERGVTLARELSTELVSAIDPLDLALRIDGTAIQPRIAATLAALRDECLAGFTASFVEVVAELNGVTPQDVENAMTASDRALVTGKHVIDAIAALIADRRATMRAIEAGFTSETGQPWTALRYFTSEEDADDVSVPVLRGAGLAPAGLGEFLFELFPATGDSRARCRAVLATDAVPHYGVDLADDHHATCWRIDHIETVADLGAAGAKRRALTTPSVRAPRTRFVQPRIDEWSSDRPRRAPGL